MQEIALLIFFLGFIIFACLSLWCLKKLQDMAFAESIANCKIERLEKLADELRLEKCDLSIKLNQIRREK
jgi:hypothetical protein|tara:strand:- start:132 stop:341 length:210 start_codon:yes stop_codon:yes gene_type:complete